MKKQPIKRLSFDLVEFLKALEGWQGTEGYVVVPKDAFRKVVVEAKRLQDVELATIQIYDILAMEGGEGTWPLSSHPAIKSLRELLETEQSES